jgi:hypothetical protein
MAAFVAVGDPVVFGSEKVVRGTFTFDSSYPTGGEAVTAATFGLSYLSWLQLDNISDVVTKHARWDRANSKIMLFIEDGTTGISAQAANASDQSAVDLNMMAFGY